MLEKTNTTLHTFLLSAFAWVGLVALTFYWFPPFGLSGSDFYRLLWAGVKTNVSVFGFHFASPQQIESWKQIIQTFNDIAWWSNPVYWELMITGVIMVIVAMIVTKLRIRSTENSTRKHSNTIDNLKSHKHRSRVLKQGQRAEEGIYIGQIGRKPLYASIEDRILIFGPPGTGKTAFMLNALIRWIRTRQSFVIIDIKSSEKERLSTVLAQELNSEGYDTHIINPTQPERGHYNPLDDVNTAEAIAELTAGLIPNDGAREPVFIDNSRNLVEAIVAHLGEQQASVSLPDVYRFIVEYEEVDKLLDDLSQSPSTIARNNAKVMRIVSQSERLMGSIFATLLSSLKVFQYEPTAKTFAHSDFTLKSMGKTKPMAVFLQFEEERLRTTGKLLALMVGHMLQHFIEFAEERGPILFVAEEIGNCPFISGLREKLNTIRSRRIPFMMLFQTMAQMDKYGQKAGEGAAYIMASADCKITFRLNDYETQTAFSNLLGQFEREHVTRAKSYQGDKTTTTRTTTKRWEQVVQPADLGKLKKGQAVVIYAGEASLAKAVPYFEAYPEYRWGARSLASQA